MGPIDKRSGDIRMNSARPWDGRASRRMVAADHWRIDTIARTTERPIGRWYGGFVGKTVRPRAQLRGPFRKPSRHASKKFPERRDIVIGSQASQSFGGGSGCATSQVRRAYSPHPEFMVAPVLSVFPSSLIGAPILTCLTRRFFAISSTLSR
jgi:hypothetical protein